MVKKGLILQEKGLTTLSQGKTAVTLWVQIQIPGNWTEKT